MDVKEDYFALTTLIKTQNVAGIEQFHQSLRKTAGNDNIIIKCRPVNDIVYPYRVLEPLFYAATHGYPKSLLALIQLGYDCDIKDTEESYLEPMTPLEYLSITEIEGHSFIKCVQVNMECVKILIGHATFIPKYWENFMLNYEDLLAKEMIQTIDITRLLNTTKKLSYSKKELYNLCFSRHINVQTRMNKETFIRLLTEYVHDEEPKHIYAVQFRCWEIIRNQSENILTLK